MKESPQEVKENTESLVPPFGKEDLDGSGKTLTAALRAHTEHLIDMEVT